MPSNVESDYRAWFTKAQEDETALQTLMLAGTAFGPACFHAQQMAEKYLKGLLVFHKKSFPKVHDLLSIETLLLNIDPDVSNLHTDLVILNEYSIRGRYPGDEIEITLSEAQQAATAANRVKSFVTSKLGV